MNDGSHLTLEGLNLIRTIKSGMNSYLFETTTLYSDICFAFLTFVVRILTFVVRIMTFVVRIITFVVIIITFVVITKAKAQAKAKAKAKAP